MSDPIQRGRFAPSIRHGETVERSPGADVMSVHALLRHLKRNGFALSPRLLGVTAEGRENPSYPPGDSGYPPLSETLRGDATLNSVAAAIRALHDAGQGFVARQHSRWHRMELAAPTVIDGAGNHDLAPWNLAFTGSEATGIVDFDTAGHSNRAWDLAYAAYHWIPVHPPDGLAGFGWTGRPDRARRLRLFTDTYGGGQADLVVDFAALRLPGRAAYLEQQAHAGDPPFRMHAEEQHAGGYRRAATSIVTHRSRLLGQQDDR